MFEPDYKKALPVEFFRRNTLEVARDLLGKALVRVFPDNSIVAAMLVETEAYRADGDLSCHASVGRTERNAPLFENGGILYVYKIYGIHHCVNIVTETNEIGSGVLLRAAMPLVGLDIMKKNRIVADKSSDSYKLINKIKDSDLCRGPGNLARSFGFTLKNKFNSVTGPELFVQPYLEVSNEQIEASPRIGVTKSAELLHRFYLKENEWVSGVKKRSLKNI